MTSPDPAGFGYQIRPTRDGWAWVTYSLGGEPQAHGWAPEKALAAAYVVEALARAAIAGEVVPAAA